MSNATTIDSLQLEITSSSTSASAGLDALTASLEKLKIATKGGLGLTSVIKRINGLGDAAKNIDSNSINNLNGLASAIQTLSSLGGVKISSSIANQINAISDAFKNADFTTSAGKIQTLVSALDPLQNLGKTNLSSYVSQLKQLPTVFAELGNIDMAGVSSKIQEMVTALAPLGNLGKNNLSGYINAIKKLPDTFAELNKIDMSAVSAKIKELAAALKPLGDEMQKVANGFSAFPAKLQKALNSTNKMSTSSKKAAGSFTDLYHKIKLAVGAMKAIGNTVAQWITLSGKYTETMNLFNVSMGEYAKEAFDYAQSVSEVMGIDPADWAYNQGIFMTLAKGFGVAGDRASTMSQQLTQLGYDLSSFYNISVGDAMTKLQSGLSGELEPLRRLGYDLSQAKLEAVALSLGIDKAVSSMTQAEKAELRYYAIMTQVTDAHGDMARTLESPQNQIRIMKSQVTQLGRALGDLFIPMLNKLLPIGIAVTKVLREAVSSFATLMGIELGGVDWGTDSMTSATEDIVSNLEDGQDEAKKLKSYMMGFDELNVLGNDDDSDEGYSGTGFSFELPEYDFLGEATNERIEGIASAIRKVFEPLSKVVDLTKEWAEGVDLAPMKTAFEGLGTTLEKVGTKIGDALGWVYEDILLPIAEWLIESGIPAMVEHYATKIELFGTGLGIMKDGLATLVDDLKPIFAWIGEVFVVLVGHVTSLWEKLTKVLSDNSGKITGIFAGIGDVISVLWAGLEPIANAVLYVVDLFLDLCSDFIALSWDYVINTVASLVDIIAGIFNGDWGQVWDGITGIFEAGWEYLVSTGKAYLDFMLGIIAPIANWIDTHVIQPIKTFFVNLWNGIVSAAVACWNGIVYAWNAVSEWFNTYVIKPVANFFVGLWNGIVAVGKACWDGIVAVATACWNGILIVFTPVVEWFSKLFGSVKQTISDIFYNIGVIIKGCWEVIKAVWGIVSEWFNTKVIQPIASFFAGLWNGIKSAAQSCWSGIKSIWNTVSNWFNENIVTPVKNFFTGLWNGIKSGASAAWSGIKTAFSTATTWVNDKIVKPVTNAFTGIWNGLKNGAKAAWEGVKSVFSSVASFFKKIFTDAWEGVKKVFSVGGKIFSGIKDGIVSAFKTIVNALIKGINKVVAVPFNAINTALSKIKNIKILGLEPFKDLKTISIPEIPLLAEGGIVNSGQLFVAREAGAELVGNVRGKTAVMNNDQIVESVSAGVYQAVLAAMGANNSDGGDTRIVINLDGEKIYENQQKVARNRGYNMGMGAFSFG